MAVTAALRTSTGADCGENYELKSQRRGYFDRKIVDGAYGVMMRRLASHHVPNLILLGYEVEALRVTNLMVAPGQFLVPELIEKRKPLAASARRAGWTGCNILLDRIPPSGRIHLIQNRLVRPKEEVLVQWRRTLFLRESDLNAKGWLLSVMRCIERLGRQKFSLQDIYSCESELMITYPGNRHIRAKIRQRLQVLRDKRYLDFLGKGMYRVLS